MLDKQKLPSKVLFLYYKHSRINKILGLLKRRFRILLALHLKFKVKYISKLLMPPSSTDRFLTAPVRAARSSKRHLYSISCQEPARSLYVAWTIRNSKTFKTIKTTRTIRTINTINTISTIKTIGIIKTKLNI